MYHNRQSFIALTFKQMPVPKIVAVLWGVHVCVAIAAILLCTLDNRAYERRCWERCYLQGVEALSRGQFDQARSWQELALKEAVALKDDHFRRGRTFCELAAIAYGQGDARLAVSMYRNAIEQLLHACGQLEGPAQELALREASVARSGLIESLVLQGDAGEAALEIRKLVSSRDFFDKLCQNDQIKFQLLSAAVQWKLSPSDTANSAVGYWLSKVDETSQLTPMLPVNLLDNEKTPARSQWKVAYSRGIECQLNHQFKQAGKHFRNALPLAGTSSVCKAVCTDILVRLGDIANATEQQLSARYYYQQAAEQIGDKADKRCAGLQFKLGQSFLSEGKVIDAKRHLEKALSLISVSNEEELRISCLASLSSCALASEQFDEACNYMDELLAVLRDDSCKHQSLKKLLLRRLVEMNVDNGDKSITYLRRLLSVTDQDKDFPDSQTLDCATRLAERYLWSDRADQARKVLYEIKKVLSSGPRENSRSAELLRMAMVSLRLGQAEERLHHPDEAEKLFAVAYEQARKTLPAGSRRLWPFLEILAARHLVNGRADSNSLVKARQDYQAILELNTRYKWNLSHAQLYSVNFNLAAILERTHNTDGAIIFFKEALGHASYCQSCFFSKASWRIASIYLEQKNIAAARRYVDAALRTECGRNHNDQRRASLLALSGTIAMWEERFERARSDLESARKIYARIGADESVVSGLCNQLNDTRLKQPR